MTREGSRPRTVPGLVLCLWLAGCAGPGGRTADQEVELPAREPAVRPAAMDSMPLRVLAGLRGIGIGTAVDRSFGSRGPYGERYRELLAREFDVLTPENDLKHVRIHPAPDSFAFARADSLVAYAEDHGMLVRGHTLVWHRQLAEWLTGGSWRPGEVEALLRRYIAAVVGHYRGRLVAWDVVNEAIGDDATRRATLWSEQVGPDYVETAFRAARAADPDVALFYNDYGIEGMSPKSDSTYALLSHLLERGVPVDGIGFQGHFEVEAVPAREELVANFQRFADLGLVVHITELDVRIPLPADAAELRQQAVDYATVVGACLEVAACEMIVFWGFTDRDSWIPNAFPGWGAALPFDARLRRKPAYDAVRDVLLRR